MTLKKSVRTVYRYIKFQYISESKKSPDELQREINGFMREMYGSVHAPYLKLISFSGNIGVFKCAREHFVEARSAFGIMCHPAYRIKQLRSSGTIKGLN